MGIIFFSKKRILLMSALILSVQGTATSYASEKNVSGKNVGSHKDHHPKPTYTPKPTPSPSPTPTVTPKPTITPTPTPTVTPKPTPTVTPKPTTTPTPSPTPTVTPTPTPTVTPKPTPTPAPSPTSVPVASGNISAAWANDGEDKVTKDELRVGRPNGKKVVNKLWNGNKIIVSGARNEVVNFNLVLESLTNQASNVQVNFDTLVGPGGATIKTTPTTGNGVFNWVNRPIELFFVRYLQIKGLSHFGFDTYDERHVPERMQRPWTGSGYAVSTSTWTDRPDHDKFYPDIAVPMELSPTFNIPVGENQSVWADIYIPKNVAAGLYQGQVTITEGGVVTKVVPVELTIANFSLPDTPTAKTMLVYSGYNVNERYVGSTWVQGANEPRAKLVQDRHFLLAHRHKISLINDNSNINSDYTSADHPSDSFAARLQNGFFTAANGYDGPGVNVSNNIYSVGTYGSWSFQDTEANMRTHSDNWVNWFEQNAPGVDYFLYLIDESSNYLQTETWAKWLLNNPGPGNRLKSMATISLLNANANTPSLQIPTTTFGVGIASLWEPLAQQYTSDPNKRFYMYNGLRPGSGSFMTEDDGVSLRELAWGQYKKHINRWFYWESTYYNDSQAGGGKRDLFQSAPTFGVNTGVDPIRGETGYSYSNGDGVLFYPGTDTLFPTDSYGVDGPIASLRLKYWRRGLQDHDYLTLAAQICPASVQTIVNATVPKALWDYGVSDVTDPTWVRTPISWSTDPDVWETARAQLSKMIETGVCQ